MEDIAITLFVVILFIAIGAYASIKTIGNDIKISVHVILSTITVFSIWGSATVGIKSESPFVWLIIFICSLGAFVIYAKKVSAGLTVKQALLIYFGITLRMFAALLIVGIALKGIMLLIHL